MNRRQWLKQSSLAALLTGTSGLPRLLAADEPKRRLLMYTRSAGYQHSVITRKAGKLSWAERIVTELGGKHNIEVVCEKDGRIFESKEFPGFDGFLFETTGDLTSEKCQDGSPPMSRTGKKALLDAVAGGKGFVGCHCASDTFHSPGDRWKNQESDKIDPYIAMVGGEFSGHGAQQKAWMRVVDADFPGVKEMKDFELTEEWYSLKNFAPDLHVIFVQDTGGMKNFDYERPRYPATWARRHKKGRVFYTSMGHREDVWQSEIMGRLLVGALNWTLGRVDAEVPPNLKTAAPKAGELPKQWTQLFNGSRDLAGWKTHPDDKATWRVEKGILIGTGPAGHLFSERGDYQNFRFRVEAQINDKGNSGQYFRAKFGRAFPRGYEAQINSTGGDPIKTGSLYPAFNRNLSDEQLDKILVKKMLVKPNEWFTQEVIADGNHIIIKVNGKTTVDFVDEKNTFTKGHFALQQHNDGSEVRFRKIEVIELPATK